jgi:hypothetical protein
MPFVRVASNVIDRKVDYVPVMNLARTFGKKYMTEEELTALPEEKN